MQDFETAFAILQIAFQNYTQTMSYKSTHVEQDVFTGEQDSFDQDPDGDVRPSFVPINNVKGELGVVYKSTVRADCWGFDRSLIVWVFGLLSTNNNVFGVVTYVIEVYLSVNQGPSIG